MIYTYFLGFDISKHTLDVALVRDGQQVFYEQIENNPKAIRVLMKKLAKQAGFDLKQSLVWNIREFIPRICWST